MTSFSLRFRFARALAACASLSLLLASTPVSADDAMTKKPVTSQDDLPRFNYPVTGTALSIVDGDEATFAAFAVPVRADLEKTLVQYDIQDHSALRGLLNEELAFQVLSGHEDAAALDTIAKIRALEDKPDARLTDGLATEALLRARIATHAMSGVSFDTAFGKAYASELSVLPFAVVRNRIESLKSQHQILSASLLDGVVTAQVEPAVAKSHMVGNDLAGEIVGLHLAHVVSLPLQKMELADEARYVAANNVVKPEIWSARDITFPAAETLTPVRIGIWDSGTDPAVYGASMITDPNPGANNPHGLAFDLAGFRSPSDLLPLTPDQQTQYLTFRTYLKGFSDLQSSIDSPEATSLKAYLASLTPAQVPAFLQNLNMFGDYSHGSHVTGIALKGNPAARVVLSRITFDYKNLKTAPNEPDEQRAMRDYQLTVDYFKTHGVRVVNMSWGGTPNDIETVLEQNGIGKDAAERKSIARHYFDEDTLALKNALASAPGILFVCAAGNADNNAKFGDEAPSSLVLPNLIAVGAVDQAGEAAPFTTYGPTVVVDADGYQVPSTIPGGYVVPFSGTSMASPTVVNLAAKLLAVDPKLTPAQLITLIRNGATASDDGRLHLIDPAKSLDLLRSGAD